MISALHTPLILAHNENIPVRRNLTLEEDQRTGKRSTGGTQFRIARGRIYVTVVYRGRRIYNSFGTSAGGYSRAKRWKTHFYNLKARERDFWRFSPHIHQEPHRFLIYGYCSQHRKRVRSIVLYSEFNQLEKWEEAKRKFYALSKYDPARDGANVTMKDFGGWMPPSYTTLNEVLDAANASSDLVADGGFTLSVGAESD